MKPATRPVTRATYATVRDAGKTRHVIVTLYPDGTLGLRLERCRKTEFVPAVMVYSMAVKIRVAQERRQRKERK